MDVKGDSGEVSDGNEEHFITKYGEDDLCYKVANNFAEFCSSVLQKLELASDGIECLAEEISMLNVEGVAQFLLRTDRRET